MSTKRAVIVARVSTAQQAEQGRSIPSQLAAMRDYAEHAGFQVIAELQDDIPGTVPIRERPGGRRLYEFIDGRRADAVIFYTVDRITRDEDLIEINVIRRDCRDAGIELHYAADGGRADLSTWGGVIDTLKAAGAAEERKKIIERNARGRKAKAQSGRWVGAGDAPFGYQRTGHGKQSSLAINESEAAIVRRIFALFIGAGGRRPMGIRTMTELFTAEGVQTPAQHGRSGKHNKRGWHQRSIHMILTRELYAGVLTYGDAKADAPHLAIIDRATFEAAQARRAYNLQMASRRMKQDYLLRGHLRCTCGRAMTGKAKHQPYRYYYCSGRSLPKHLRNCDEPLINAKLVEPAVWDWIQRICTDEDALAAALDELARRSAASVEPKRTELARLDREIERERRAINVWTQAYATASNDDELEDLKANVKAAGIRLTPLRSDRERLQGEIEQGSVSHHRQRELLEGVQMWRDEILNADDEARAYILERLRVQARLRHDDAGLWVDVGLMLDDDSDGSRFATKTLRSALPATREQCCDSRPVPRNRAGRTA